MGIHEILSSHGGRGGELGAETLFSSFIDDVRIYKQALTADEIAALPQ